MTSLSTIPQNPLIPFSDTSKEKFLLRVRESLLSKKPALILPSLNIRISSDDTYPEAPSDASQEEWDNIIQSTADNYYNPASDTIDSFKQDQYSGDVHNRFVLKYVESLAELLDVEAQALLSSMVPPLHDVSSETNTQIQYGDSAYSPRFNPLSIDPDIKSYFDLTEDEYDNLLASPEGPEILSIYFATAELLISSLAFIPVEIQNQAIGDPIGFAESLLNGVEGILETIILNPIVEFIIEGIETNFPLSNIMKNPQFFSIYSTVLSYGISYGVLAIVGILFGTGVAYSGTIVSLFDIV